MENIGDTSFTIKKSRKREWYNLAFIQGFKAGFVFTFSIALVDKRLDCENNYF